MEWGSWGGEVEDRGKEGKVGDEVVVALTKVLESNESAQFSGWEKEFSRRERVRLLCRSVSRAYGL